MPSVHRPDRGVKADARPVEAVLELLPDARPAAGGHVARCPAHDDSDPSLSIGEADDGRVLLHCFAGCAAETVADALGLTMADLMPNGVSKLRSPGRSASGSRPGGSVFRAAREAVESLERKLGPGPQLWTYHNSDGEPVGVVARWDQGGNKHIRPVSRHKDGWRVGAMPAPRPLYRLPELAGAETVVVTEGEKCADTAARLGFAATTSAGGAGAPHLTDWSPLAGKKVKILPDNDAAGRKYASEVAARLAALDPPAEVQLVELPGLPDKGDIADWLDARPGAADAELRAELEALFAAPPQPPDPPPDPAVTAEPCEDRPWPAPLDDAAFIGPLGEYVRLIAPDTEADPGATLVQSLLLFGAAAGRSAHAVVGSACHHANEFLVVVGDTSGGRKGTSFSDAKAALVGVDDAFLANRVATGLSSGEGLIHFVRDPVEKKEAVREKGKPVRYEVVVADEGEPDKRGLIVEPEFVNVLKQAERAGNTLSPVVRQAWDGGELRTLVKTSPTRATGAHVSIVGHITEAELKKYFCEVEAANGFGNRFLWWASRRSQFLPEPPAPDPARTAGVRGRVLAALEFARTAGRIDRDDEARELWREVYPTLERDRPGLAGALTARAAPHVIRLAVIYALSERSACVQARHLMAALAIWEYSERSVAYLFGESTGDAVADDALRLIRQSPGGATRSDISNFFGRNLPSARLSEALNALMKSGKVRREMRAGAAGRPAEVWYAVEGTR